MNNNVTPTTTIKKELRVEKGYRRINLENLGDQYLLTAVKFRTTFEVVSEVKTKTEKHLRLLSKKQVHEETEEVFFFVKRISLSELSVLRRGKKAGFVLKLEEQYFYAEIPRRMDFREATILGEHQCANAEKVCQRLSAASDVEGGCAKIREFSSCIEKYPWITKGYETFNTRHDSFLVAKCENYKVEPPRSKKTSAQMEIEPFCREDAKKLFW